MRLEKVNGRNQQVQYNCLLLDSTLTDKEHA